MSPGRDGDDADVGLLLLKMASNFKEWLPRRVDRVELLDHLTARRRTRLDVDLRGLKEEERVRLWRRNSSDSGCRLATWRGSVLVPLATADRRSHTTFDVTREDGTSPPRLTRDQERHFVLQGLLYVARTISREDEEQVAAAIKAAVNSEPGVENPLAELRDLAAGRVLLRNGKFKALLMLAVHKYFVVVGLDPDHCRQVVFYETTEPVTPQVRSWRHLVGYLCPRSSSLGLHNVTLDCPAAEACYSYHVEVVAPVDLQVNGQVLVAHRQGDDEAKTYEDQDVTPNMAHGYLSNSGVSQLRKCAFVVQFRHAPTGMIISAPMAALVTSAVMLLGFVCVMRTRQRNIDADLQTMTGLLLLFPAFLGALIAQPEHHSLTARVVFPTRALLVLVCLLPWIAGFLLLAEWKGTGMLLAADALLEVSLILSLVLLCQYATLRRLSVVKGPPDGLLRKRSRLPIPTPTTSSGR
jgi:hypothetical protein